MQYWAVHNIISLSLSRCRCHRAEDSGTRVAWPNRFAADLFNSIRADLLRQQEAQPFSVGSAGHPYTCSNPCKYVWRKQGCRDGADCPNCHYCKWQRKPKEEANDVGTPVGQAGEHLEAMLANIPPPPGLTPMEPTSEMKTQQRLGSKISYMPDSMILSAHFVHSKDKAQESNQENNL